MSFIRIGNCLIKLDSIKQISLVDNKIFISYVWIESKEDFYERYVEFDTKEQAKQEFENVSRILGCKYQLDNVVINLPSQPSSQQPSSQPSSQASSQQPS